MEVNFNPKPVQVAPGRSAPPRANRCDTPSEPALSASRSLESRLEEVPEVRPEAVEKGKALVSSTSYPPPELVGRISRLLALALSPPSSE